MSVASLRIWSVIELAVARFELMSATPRWIASEADRVWAAFALTPSSERLRSPTAAPIRLTDPSTECSLELMDVVLPSMDCVDRWMDVALSPIRRVAASIPERSPFTRVSEVRVAPAIWLVRSSRAIASVSLFRPRPLEAMRCVSRLTCAALDSVR